MQSLHVMKYLKRQYDKIVILSKVSFQLGDGMWMRLYMLLGGLWLLINDSWKSDLKLNIRIRYSNRIGEFLVSDFSDYELFNEIFLSNSYPAVSDKEKLIIVDLGANVGISALFFKMIYPDSIIYCVEPDQNNLIRLKMLEKNFENLFVIDKAVWSENDFIPIYSNPIRGSSSSLISDSDNRNKMLIESISLDKLIELIDVERIDLLKFDIEGAEHEVFTKYSDYHKIDNVFGEVHGDMINSDDIFNIFKKNYYFVIIKKMQKADRYYLYAMNKEQK